MANNSKSIKEKVGLLSNQYLVFRSTVGLLLISFGALLLSPLKEEGSASKLLLVLLYSIIVFLWVALIGEFVLKTLRLQNEKDVNRYTAIVSANVLLGLFIPIMKISVLLDKIIFDFLRTIPHTGTIFCEIRFEIINYYKYYNVHGFLTNFAFWALVIAATLFLWGGFIEKMWRKR